MSAQLPSRLLALALGLGAALGLYVAGSELASLAAASAGRDGP